MSMFIVSIYCAITITNAVISEIVYRRYFSYAKRAVRKKDWGQGFGQSQNWFWSNDILMIQSAIPVYWFWRTRKAGNALNEIISRYP